MTALFQNAKLYLGGVEAPGIGVDYGTTPGETYAVGMRGSTTGEYTVEFATKVEGDFSKVFDALTAPPTATRMQLHYGRIAFGFGATFPSDALMEIAASDETLMSVDMQPDGPASITCACGLGREYASFRRAAKALTRWRRHVCPRGAR